MPPKVNELRPIIADGDGHAGNDAMTIPDYVTAGAHDAAGRGSLVEQQIPKRIQVEQQTPKRIQIEDDAERSRSFVARITSNSIENSGSWPPT